MGLLVVGSSAAGERGLLGFVGERVPGQLELEESFDSHLRADGLRERMKHLTAHPHHVGSPYGKANAHWIASEFESWGYQTKIEVFHVLFPTPKVRVVEMIAPEKFSARLTEPALAQDSTSRQRQEQLPPYNAYSPDGDVTAELVYVNQGLPPDYEELKRRGIDVRGKIVIARYGGSWRGIKPKIATKHGALACILYSDPRDDGYSQGDVYPHGAFKSGSRLPFRCESISGATGSDAVGPVADDLLGLQLVDLALRAAELGQNLAIVLPEHRRRAVEPRRD